MMMSAMPWSKRDTLVAREGARPLPDWVTDWMTACAPWKPSLSELAGGVEAVAGLGVFDLEHDVDEEADYLPAVVGLLADDVGEGWWLIFGLVCFRWRTYVLR